MTKHRPETYQRIAEFLVICLTASIWLIVFALIPSDDMSEINKEPLVESMDDFFEKQPTEVVKPRIHVAPGESVCESCEG
jgi:hypothetical protein